jgi:hypothetical protein
MRFEWDDLKAALNLAKHGVPFEYATRVFLDRKRVDFEDTRQHYGEQRRVTLGVVDDRLHAVTYTLRQESIRLISARKANAREQRRYEKLSVRSQ